MSMGRWGNVCKGFFNKSRLLLGMVFAIVDGGAVVFGEGGWVGGM